GGCGDYTQSVCNGRCGFFAGSVHGDGGDVESLQRWCSHRKCCESGTSDGHHAEPRELRDAHRKLIDRMTDPVSPRLEEERFSVGANRKALLSDPRRNGRPDNTTTSS